MKAYSLIPLPDPIRERRAKQRAAIQAMADATATGDIPRLVDAIEQIDQIGDWTKAFSALGRLEKKIPARMKQAWLGLWIGSGDHLRGEVRNDFLLTKALVKPLPPYQGPPVRLYRGETKWNRRRRTYGLSWTSQREVAVAHARGILQTYDGGSVVLQTDAPAKAIICAPAHHGRHQARYHEREYLVDRRQLREIKVLSRFAQREL